MGRVSWDTWEWGRGNNARSFEDCYRRFYWALHRLIYEQVQDHQRTQDLIQETFFRVFQISRKSSGRVLSPDHLRRIAGRQIKDDQLLRVPAESLDALIVEADGEIVRQQSRWPIVEQHWCESEAVWDVFAHLSPQEQMMLDLRYLDDYSLPQIANIQQIPATRVRSRLTQAERSFRRKLGWSLFSHPADK